MTKYIITEQQFKDLVKAYHGSPQTIDVFCVEYVGRGNDQEGPGIYFSSDEEDVCKYGDKKHTVNLSFRKLVSTTKPPRKAEVEKLMRLAPNLRDTLEGWDENPRRAFITAMELMLDVDTQHEAFLNVWYDFYRNTPKEFVQNMVKMGYDGVAVPRAGGITHYVVYNPKSIEMVKENMDEASTPAWQRKEGRVGGKAGLNAKGVASYRRQNPGSKLQGAVTEKNPSESRSKRRKSFCARNRGTMDAHNVNCRETPDKPSCVNHRRWRCKN